MSAKTPKNYEEWLDTAPIEELVKGLYERLQVAEEEKQKLQEELEALKNEFNNFKVGIVAHKHAAQTGEATIPMGAVLSVAR